MRDVVFLNQYEALRFLGQGSMGMVYLPRHVATNAEVVVKVIRPEVAAGPEFRHFFDTEIESLAQLRHPCVVGLLDAAYQDAHGPCLVMEYIRGICLESVVDKFKVLPVELVYRLLIPLCRALTAGHACQIVHRDLKPANLMVTDPETDAISLKVMDFGLAQLNAKPHIPLDKLRGGGSINTYGTPVYVAPDGLRGDATDYRADLYSVGVILFELLMGVPPFNYRDMQTVLTAQVKERPPRFAQVRPNHGLPPEVEAVVRQCLEKYPNERPQSAREIAEAFGRAIRMPLTDADFPETAEQLAAAADRRTNPKLPPPGMYTVTRPLDAWMPEPIAVVKLRGFVEDKGGEILDSQPGMIRVQFDRRPAPPPPARTHSLMKWVGGLRRPEPPRPAPPDPIDLRLYLSHSATDRTQRLQMTIVFEPLDAGALNYPDRWHARCEALFHDLRGYLMAK